MAQWNVNGTVEVPQKRKAPYAPKQRMKDDMSDSQKEGVRIWNAWHDVLKENGLMEEKPN